MLPEDSLATGSEREGIGVTDDSCSDDKSCDRDFICVDDETIVKDSDEDLVAVIRINDPWLSPNGGAAVANPQAKPKFRINHAQVSAPKKKYKPVGVKKHPVATTQPLEAEASVLTELEDWERRMEKRDLRHLSEPVINDQTIKDLSLPVNWTAEEMNYLTTMLKDCSKAFAWSEADKGRIDPRVVPPIKIQVVENQGFKCKAPFLNARVVLEVTDILKEKIANGELERCSGAYSGKWYVLRKPNGKLRWISNFQDLNSITIRNVGSIPRAEEFTESLCGYSVYSLLDAMGGYDQQYLDRHSRDYTGILTCFGHLRWTILPQGWTNSVARFQDAMYRVFGESIPHLIDPYVDDIPVKGPRDKDETFVLPGLRRFVKQHVDDLRKVLSRAVEVGLTFSAKKVVCGVSKLKVLSTIVGPAGKEIDPDKVFKIVNWPRPTSSFEANSFLGLCKFVRPFINHFRHKSKNLGKFISKTTPFVWTDECEEEFNALKEAVSTAPVLMHIDWEAATKDTERPLVLCFDAGPELWGAVIKQKDAEGAVHPCRFESRAFTKGEVKHPQGIREMKALYNALSLWKDFFYGLYFVVETDSQNVRSWISKKREEFPNNFVAHWAGTISTYTFEVRWVASEKMWADSLSRRSVNEKEIPEVDPYANERSIVGVHSMRGEDAPVLIRYEWLDDKHRAIAEHIMRVPLSTSIRGAALSSLRQSAAHYAVRDGYLFKREDNPALPLRRVICLPEQKENILELCHGGLVGGHRGIPATIGKIRRLYWWRGMNNDIKNWVRKCDTCQRATDRPRFREPGMITSSAGILSKVHVDVTYLPTGTGGEKPGSAEYDC